MISEWQAIYNWKILGATLLVSLFVFAKLGLYRAVMRYAGERIISVILIGSAASVAVMLAASFYLHLPLPRSVPIMYFLLLLVLMIGP